VLNSGEGIISRGTSPVHQDVYSDPDYISGGSSVEAAAEGHSRKAQRRVRTRSVGRTPISHPQLSAQRLASNNVVLGLQSSGVWNQECVELALNILEEYPDTPIGDIIKITESSVSAVHSANSFPTTFRSLPSSHRQPDPTLSQDRQHTLEQQGISSQEEISGREFHFQHRQPQNVQQTGPINSFGFSSTETGAGPQHSQGHFGNRDQLGAQPRSFSQPVPAFRSHSQQDPGHQGGFPAYSSFPFEGPSSLDSETFHRWEQYNPLSESARSNYKKLRTPLISREWIRVLPSSEAAFSALVTEFFNLDKVFIKTCPEILAHQWTHRLKAHPNTSPIGNFKWQSKILSKVIGNFIGDSSDRPLALKAIEFVPFFKIFFNHLKGLRLAKVAKPFRHSEKCNRLAADSFLEGLENILALELLVIAIPPSTPQGVLIVKFFFNALARFAPLLWDLDKASVNTREDDTDLAAFFQAPDKKNFVFGLSSSVWASPADSVTHFIQFAAKALKPEERDYHRIKKAKDKAFIQAEAFNSFRPSSYKKVNFAPVKRSFKKAQEYSSDRASSVDSASSRSSRGSASSANRSSPRPSTSPRIQKFKGKSSRKSNQ
jgi:hypothetical protein